jgi:hypothetical protein
VLDKLAGQPKQCIGIGFPGEHVKPVAGEDAPVEFAGQAIELG